MKRLKFIDLMTHIGSRIFLVILGIIIYPVLFAQKFNNEGIRLKFIMNNETLQPLNVKNGVLYISPEKLTGISDSIKAETYTSFDLSDTIYVTYPWKFPVHAYFIIQFSDNISKSNVFYLDPSRKNYILTVNNTGLIIKPQPRYSFDEKKSFLGIILLIQTAIELLLALLFYKIFNWPKWIILAILVANLAAFSVYFIKISPQVLSDLSMVGVKLLVLVLLGRRKLGILKIISIVLILNIISFGIKEILTLLTRIM